MKTLFGNLTGLKPSAIKDLEKLGRQRVTPAVVISQELARRLGRISSAIGRQVGLLINRDGRVAMVVVGTATRIVIPDTPNYRLSPGRLRGLRCVHTHLDGAGLSPDDLTDLALLRLDLMAALTVDESGLPREIHTAHILPVPDADLPYQILPPSRMAAFELDCQALITALEAELARLRPRRQAGKTVEQAFLIKAFSGNRRQARADLAELEALAISAGIVVVDRYLQQRRRIDPRFVLGRGKLTELVIAALQNGVTLLIFDQELQPAQIRSISQLVDLKVIDRTQLILDIFAQRAQSREGKLQVELAQLKYLLPRLVTKNTAMSRLTGGIGGRGPGETKLEISRRRARDRIIRLEKEVRKVRGHRQRQRSRRLQRQLPVISIVGYTNAGKSTLLNTLTQSAVVAESRLFATLDPSTRRLRFPRDVEVVITDTVGFIRDLPRELMAAFHATLEELESADLLLHVIDISNPAHMQQIQSVEHILEDLGLSRTPLIRVLNKQDRLPADQVTAISQGLDGVGISARDRKSLTPLVQRVKRELVEKTAL